MYLYIYTINSKNIHYLHALSITKFILQKFSHFLLLFQKNLPSMNILTGKCINFYFPSEKKELQKA